MFWFNQSFPRPIPLFGKSPSLKGKTTSALPAGSGDLWTVGGTNSPGFVWFFSLCSTSSLCSAGHRRFRGLDPSRWFGDGRGRPRESQFGAFKPQLQRAVLAGVGWLVPLSSLHSVVSVIRHNKRHRDVPGMATNHPGRLRDTGEVGTPG